MADHSARQPAHGKNSKKGGRFLPALCSVIGTLVVLGVIVLLLPVTVPKLLGYEVYNVISESMTPAIPRGSLVLVRPSVWHDVSVGDVIAFESGGTVVTHRVTEIRADEGEFVTKGDANEQEDMVPISFSALIGRVVWHVPYLGEITSIAVDTSGKIRLFVLLLGGILFRMLGERLRKT